MMRAKGIVAALVLVTAAVLVSTAGSGPAPPPGNGGASASDTTGDHPPTTSFTLKGRIGVTVSALPYNAVGNPSGTFNVSGIPTGSTIVKALLYVIDWETGAAASATFAGSSFGPSAALTTDLGGDKTLGIYRFAVTGRVSGNGAYDYTSSDITESYGAALVVVYKNPALHGNKIWINDGAENMCCGAKSESHFTGGPRRETNGRLLVFTGADDNIGRGESGEVISLNGNPVGGPIDANLGPYASFFDLQVTGIGLTNTVAIFTPQDRFGWHLAILSKKRQ